MHIVSGMKNKTISLSQSEVSDIVENLVETRLVVRKHKLGRIGISKRLQSLHILSLLKESPNLRPAEIFKQFGGTQTLSALSSLKACGAITAIRVKTPFGNPSVNVPKKHKSVVVYRVVANAVEMTHTAMQQPWF